MTAAPVVPLDLLCASGTSYFGAAGTPYVPGVQGVGWCMRPDLAPGTRVWFATSAGMAAGDGSLAELCAVADADLIGFDLFVPSKTCDAASIGWFASSVRHEPMPSKFSSENPIGSIMAWHWMQSARTR